jgi:hypothetical protein
MPQSRDGQRVCGIKFKKEGGHTTNNYGGKGGDHALIYLSAEMNVGNITTKQESK